MREPFDFDEFEFDRLTGSAALSATLCQLSTSLLAPAADRLDAERLLIAVDPQTAYVLLKDDQGHNRLGLDLAVFGRGHGEGDIALLDYLGEAGDLLACPLQLAIVDVDPDGADFEGQEKAVKEAVRSLTKNIAMFCKEQKNGIRCNSIHPDGVKTPMVAKVATGKETPSQEDIDMVSQFDNMCEPEDVANLVLYLASDAGRFCTGNIHRSNGGQTMAW